MRTELMIKDQKMKNRYRQAREDLGWIRMQMARKMNMDVTSVGN
jgi:ribosome-binding protein aMBF1 (putative translation factor)